MTDDDLPPPASPLWRAWQGTSLANRLLARSKEGVSAREPEALVVDIAGPLSVSSFADGGSAVPDWARVATPEYLRRHGAKRVHVPARDSKRREQRGGDHHPVRVRRRARAGHRACGRYYARPFAARRGPA